MIEDKIWKISRGIGNVEISFLDDLDIFDINCTNDTAFSRRSSCGKAEIVVCYLLNVRLIISLL